MFRYVESMAYCCAICVICAVCDICAICDFRVHQFLQNFQSVAESNNFFDPGFKPSDLDQIPELYHRIIDDPAMLHNKIVQLQSK